MELINYIAANPAIFIILVIFAALAVFFFLRDRKISMEYKGIKVQIGENQQKTEENSKELQRLRALPRLCSVVRRKLKAAIEELGVEKVPADTVLDIYDLAVTWLIQNEINDSTEYIKRRQEAILDILDPAFRTQYHGWVEQLVSETILAILHEKEVLYEQQADY